MFKTDPERYIDLQERFKTFSKWTTAVKAIAQIQRLAKKSKSIEPLNVEERRKAALTLVRLTQQNAFMDELHMLNQKSGRLPCNHHL